MKMNTETTLMVQIPVGIDQVKSHEDPPILGGMIDDVDESDQKGYVGESRDLPFWTRFLLLITYRGV